MEVDIEFVGLRENLREGQRQLAIVVARAADKAAKEGLAYALGRRRYKDRTGGLTGQAYARLLFAGLFDAQAVIGWPVPYASFVDEGTSRARAFGFAGDAYLAAERVFEREFEAGMPEVERVLNR